MTYQQTDKPLHVDKVKNAIYRERKRRKGKTISDRKIYTDEDLADYATG